MPIHAATAPIIAIAFREKRAFATLSYVDMATVYERNDSPFIWLKYKDQQGQTVQKSTGLKKTVKEDWREARAVCAEKTAEEFRGVRSTTRTQDGWVWVPEFIVGRYGQTLTGRNYRQAWVTIKLFLDREEVFGPQMLTRKNCFDYLTWRKSPLDPESEADRGRFVVKHNSALTELRTLSVVMQEAVDRGLVRANPCLRLRIRKEAPRQKPAVTPRQCQIIRDNIQTVSDPLVRDMLFYSFEISRFQGCRVAETRINPQRDIEIFINKRHGQPVKSGTIIFRAKGGKEFRTMLHPKLIPLFEDLRARGRGYTWRTPDHVGPAYAWTWASGCWWHFLDRLRKRGHALEGVSIHCNRVTVVTELAKGNVPEGKARAYVGHTSSTSSLSHRIYQRLKLEDLWNELSVVGGSVPSMDAFPSKRSRSRGRKAAPSLE